MKIGELARMASCTPQTIRYYEKEGLLPEPGRTQGNYRHYTSLHLERLRFIRNCRSLDMAHDEIRALLHCMDNPQPNCQPVNALVDEHIKHVDARLQELARLREHLIKLRKQCENTQPVLSCGIIQGLNAMTTQEKVSASHLS